MERDPKEATPTFYPAGYLAHIDLYLSVIKVLPVKLASLLLSHLTSFRILSKKLDS